MSETNTLQQIRDLLNKGGTRLFRNNVGKAWCGNKYTKRGNALIIDNPRPLNAGLCTGSSDLIGMKSVTITPDMVGRTVAVFVAIEVKFGNNTPSEEQVNFINLVKRMGGLSGVAYSVEEAEGILNDLR